MINKANVPSLAYLERRQQRHIALRAYTGRGQSSDRIHTGAAPVMIEQVIQDGRQIRAINPNSRLPDLALNAPGRLVVLHQ